MILLAFRGSYFCTKKTHTFHLPTNNSKALNIFYTIYYNDHGHCLTILLLHLELLHHELTPHALSFIVVFVRHLSCILKRDENQLLWLTIILVGQNPTRITLYIMPVEFSPNDKNRFLIPLFL